MRAAARGPALSRAAPAPRCSAARTRPACAAPRPRASVSLPFAAAAPAAAARVHALRAAFLAAARSAAAPPVGPAAATDDDATSFVPPARPPGPAELDADDAKWLVSTRAQRLTVAAWAALEAALLAKAAAAPGALAAGWAALLVAAAWLAADLVVGVIHWGLDNYGSGATPALGNFIDAFQSHHERPWLITRGQFCTVVEGPCLVLMPLQAAALALAASPAALLFWAAFAAMIAAAQLAHAWSHANRAALPPLVRALQDAGVLISAKEHRLHHTAPIDDHYCILSGFWNGALDHSGALVALERAVHALTGAKPRSWDGGDAPKARPRKAGRAEG